MIDLNALLRRPVEYYEYPWAIERHLRRAQSYLRSLSQADDVAFVFCKSMPRSGHRFLTECVEHYLGQALHYCGFYNTRADCCRRIPCQAPQRGQDQPLLLPKEPRFWLSRFSGAGRQISDPAPVADSPPPIQRHPQQGLRTSLPRHPSARRRCLLASEEPRNGRFSHALCGIYGLRLRPAIGGTRLAPCCKCSAAGFSFVWRFCLPPSPHFALSRRLP